jgi:hypothetical protein
MVFRKGFLTNNRKISQAFLTKLKLCLPTEAKITTYIPMLPLTTYNPSLNVRGKPSADNPLYVVKQNPFFIGDRFYGRTANYEHLSSN